MQAVGDVAEHFALERDRDLAAGLVGCGRALNYAGSRHVVGIEFNQRNDVGRVEGMGDDDAAGISPACLQVWKFQAG